MKNSRLLIDIFCMAAGLAIAAELYLDTGPLVCLVDPTCRTLTKDEARLAFGIFGDTIQYEDVRIFERRPFMNYDAEAYASRNNIFLPVHAQGRDAVRDNEVLRAERDGFSGHKDRPVFLHEMTHIWQYQHGGIRPGGLTGRYRFEDSKAFGAYNREQQASIVEDYARELGLLKAVEATSSPERAKGVRVACRNLATFEFVLKPVLPVASQAACAAPAP